jgi:hypothetical protein
MQGAGPVYWLDLFTGKTWDEFRKAGATVTGFRQGSRGTCERIRQGDILLAYVTGVKRWVGALEVVGPSSDATRIWADDAFPIRFTVKPLVLLEAIYGVALEDLEGKVAFFAGPQHHGGYRGFFRRSPNRFERASDGKLVMQLLQEAASNRVARPIDERAYRRRPAYLLRGRLGDVQTERVVTVPEREPGPNEPGDSPKLVEVVAGETRHTEMQWELLQLGSAMGLDVWVASNDRGRAWRGEQLAKTPRLVTELPKLFNEVTNRTIEMIDVLWLRGNSISAAFEVEATTNVYSGLLRMSDLLALQPNLNINLFIVAPESRREKVRQEILRPTFQWRDRPLSSVCGYLRFSTVKEQAEGIRRLNLAASLKPDFLTGHAEYFGRSGSVEPTIPQSDGRD